ncbi:SH3 domain-containing protein [Thalassotalea mangrovi]|nr:SH3 domain-containing protein [Thalassotalea mangrovi]
MNILKKHVAALLTLAISVGAVFHANAEEAPQVRVDSDFINIHLGPGKETPVFYVAEKDEWIELTNRRTGWFKVKTEAGVEGWIDESELKFTLDENGNRVTYNPSVVKEFITSLSK